MSVKIRAGIHLGKYKLRRRIGKGAFALVYEAYDTIQRITVALKVPTDLSDDVIDDLEYEVRMASKLDHPNVMPVLNADYIKGNLLVVAYPLAQKDLADRMDHRISVANTLRFSEQILAGLAHAHDYKIIHCDVKPENFMLFPDGTLKLIDFGLSRRHRRSGSFDSEPGGTLGYMAPELALGFPHLRSDVYGAAVTIWELFTRKLPEWPLDHPLVGSARLERLVPELLPLLRRALQRDSRRRYANAREMLEAFQPVKKRILRRLAT